MISVIIATYNAQSCLQKTLDSLKSQTNKDFELIIVDGKSKDETIDIIKANTDIVNKFIYEADKGIYDAWNKGIKISKGKWICFIGAGDTLVPEAFEKYNNLQHDEYDYISAKINRIDEKGNYLSTIGRPWIWKEFISAMLIAHVGSLHSRKMFNEIGYFDLKYKISADYELLLRRGDQLKYAFLDFTIGSMPIGGASYSIASLKEAAKAKYFTGKVKLLNVVVIFLKQLFLFKTDIIRNKFKN